MMNQSSLDFELIHVRHLMRTVSSPSQLCACQTVQTHALIRGLHGQCAVDLRRDSNAKLAAVVLFGQWHGDRLAIRLHIGNRFGGNLADARQRL